MMRLSILAAFLLLFVGCRQRESESAADLAAESTTAVVFNAAGAPTVEFDVPDMMCVESCAKQTHKILSEQPGVVDVRVDFVSKTATVAVEEEKFDTDAALAALVDYGFDNSHLKTAAAESPAFKSKAAAEPAPQPAG